MKTVTSSFLFEEISERMHERYDIPAAASASGSKIILKTIAVALAEGNRVEFRRFGTFTVKRFGKRKGRDPKTGQIVEVQPRCRVAFKAGSILAKRIDSNPASVVAFPVEED